MKAMLVRLFLVMLAVFCLIGVTPRPADAIWQIMLDEHFEEDQENPQLKWPWYTDLRAGEVPKRWYWNALLPYNRGVQGNPERHVWGLQDYIFNSKVRRDDKQALWCAYTNNNNTNNPHWPKEDDYIRDQKAWVWWGPFNMAEMKNCIISYWTYIDLKQYSYDSLSVIVVTEDQLMLDFQSTAAWRSQVAFGHVGWNDVTKKSIKSTHPNKIDQWSRFQFTLDSLLINDRWSSYVGKQEDLFVAFVWQTDAYDIQGKGAFIDDIMVVIDDGLFDLLPTALHFGYNVTEDSMKWVGNTPRAGDKIKFSLDWTALGAGMIPTFDITCKLNGQVIHTERVTEEALEDTIYTVIAPDYWTAVPGEHSLVWEVDARNEVRETVEVNNKVSVNFTVLWNPPPVHKILGPFAGGEDWIECPADSFLTMAYTVTDSNDFDNLFNMIFFIAEDTTGIAAVPARVWNPDQFVQIGMANDVPPGANEWVWDVGETYKWEQVHVDHVYYLVSVALDSDPLNLTVAVGPSKVVILPPQGVRSEPMTLVTGHGISAAFPNPFNSSLTLEYTLTSSEDVVLQMFDLAGREVATLAEGYTAPGRYSASWKPAGLSSGIYIARLKVGNAVYNKKVVYLP